MNSLATKLSIAFILVVLLGGASVSILRQIETPRDVETGLEGRDGDEGVASADEDVELTDEFVEGGLGRLTHLSSLLVLLMLGVRVLRVNRVADPEARKPLAEGVGASHGVGGAPGEGQ